MPKSKVRKKTDYTINTANRTPVKVSGPSGRLYVWLMFGLMLLGLVWICVFYIAATPENLGGDGKALAWMHALGAWNFLIGFSLMVSGLLMTMRWK